MFNNLKLKRPEKRKNSETTPSSSNSKITRRGCVAFNVHVSTCFFCDKDSGDLHQVATFLVDTKVRKCALELQDTILLAKLSADDLISQEAVYHSSCLVSLYNKTIRNRTESSGDKADKMFQGIALAELFSYTEEARTESTNSIPVFKLSDLAKLYTSRLNQLGVNILGRIHITDLKNRILSNFPDMQAHR